MDLSVYKEEFKSIGAGYLMMRAFPLSAIMSGWNLSAALGISIGEIFSLIIFLIGAVFVVMAYKMENHKYFSITRYATAVLYAAMTFSKTNHIISGFSIALFDCIIIAVVLLEQIRFDTGIIHVIWILLIGGILSRIIGLSGNETSIVAVASSLLSGFSVIYISCDKRELKGGKVIIGMTMVMIADILQ